METSSASVHFVSALHPSCGRSSSFVPLWSVRSSSSSSTLSDNWRQRRRCVREGESGKHRGNREWAGSVPCGFSLRPKRSGDGGISFVLVQVRPPVEPGYPPAWRQDNQAIRSPACFEISLSWLWSFSGNPLFFGDWWGVMASSGRQLVLLPGSKMIYLLSENRGRLLSFVFY